MKTLVIYDSMFGNTEIIAKAIADVCDAKLVKACDFSTEDIKGIDLLIIGSPTQAGNPTVLVQKALAKLVSLDDLKIAAFDTRMSMKWVKIFGFASNKIIKKLQKIGCVVAVSPEGFLVNGKEGPLADGELVRAKQWAQTILGSVTTK